MTNLSRYVATFGDSSPSHPGDWVKVIHQNLPDYGGLAKPPGRYKKSCIRETLNLSTDADNRTVFFFNLFFLTSEEFFFGVNFFLFQFFKF